MDARTKRRHRWNRDPSLSVNKEADDTARLTTASTKYSLTALATYDESTSPVWSRENGVIENNDNNSTTCETLRHCLYTRVTSTSRSRRRRSGRRRVAHFDVRRRSGNDLVGLDLPVSRARLRICSTVRQH